ncbi:MAG: cation transporter [Lachnospiraceae bacterium]|nr:cation transporter [Lachnospiraceae bacterium]
MLTLLINLFIKDKDNISDVKVRENYGVLCSGYGIFLNICLFAGKYLAGVLSASISMMADAFNNLSDAGSSIISLIGFKLASKKPDPGHPFGHGRIEYLAGLGVSALIVIMGYQLCLNSFSKIRHPEETVFSTVSIIILSVSILVKFYMAFYSKKIGKKIDSQTLQATATDSMSDTISTFVVLIGSLTTHFTGIKLDGYLGMFVGILILIAGIKSAIEVISPLLGEAPSEEFIKSVEKIVMSYDEIVGIHDLIVHDYGPGRLMITLHAEVPADGNVLDLHDVIDRAEYELGQKLNCHATIHMDPVSVGDEYVDSLKAKVKEILSNMEGIVNFHDFRVVKGNTHTNLVFDVVASYSLKRSDDEIKLDIFNKIQEYDPKLFSVITVDRDFTGK